MKMRFFFAGALMLTATAAAAQTLRIGLVDDPDLLDPAPGKSFVGRIVFQSLCDKLVDISPDLKIVPRLAVSWETTEDGKVITFKLRDGVTFQDGEKFDAASVKYNIERDKTMPESIRKSELASVDSVDAIDPLTVRFNLKKPDASLLATLSDRAGMMVAPEAAKQAGAKFGLNPVCSGPYKFVERVQQDHITLARNPNYWNAKAFSFDKIVFRTIPDSTARLAEPALGRSRHRRTRRADRCKGAPGAKGFQGRRRHLARLRRSDRECRQTDRPRRTRRPGQARSPGTLACDRPARRDGRGV